MIAFTMISLTAMWGLCCKEQVQTQGDQVESNCSSTRERNDNGQDQIEVAEMVRNGQIMYIFKQ